MPYARLLLPAFLVFAAVAGILAASISVQANPFLIDTIKEGEEVVIPANGVEYHLKLLSVPDIIQRAVFSLNGENSRALHPRERYTFSDGSILAVGSILPNEAGEPKGQDIVEYYFVGSGIAARRPQRYSTALTDVEYDLENLDQEEGASTILGIPSSSFISRFSHYQHPRAPSLKEPYLTPHMFQESPAPIPFDACTSDQDCDDGNGCTTDVCMGAPRTCKHQPSMPGCSFGTRYCVPTYRSYIIPPDSGVYCSLDRTWIEQKKDQVPCSADFECLSGVCQKKICGNPPSLEKPAETSIAQTPLGRPERSRLFDILAGFFKRLFIFSYPR